jgi:hypothetical protein
MDHPVGEIDVCVANYNIIDTKGILRHSNSFTVESHKRNVVGKVGREEFFGQGVVKQEIPEMGDKFIIGKEKLKERIRKHAETLVRWTKQGQSARRSQYLVQVRPENSLLESG